MDPLLETHMDDTLSVCLYSEGVPLARAREGEDCLRQAGHISNKYRKFAMTGIEYVYLILTAQS